MSGRLRILLIIAFVMSPVTADLRNGLIWSDAWGQPYQYPYCAPSVKLNWYADKGQGPYLWKTQIYNWDQLHCPAGSIPWCVRRGRCLSVVSVLPGMIFYRGGGKINPNGCLLRKCRTQF